MEKINLYEDPDLEIWLFGTTELYEITDQILFLGITGFLLIFLGLFLLDLYIEFSFDMVIFIVFDLVLIILPIKGLIKNQKNLHQFRDSHKSSISIECDVDVLPEGIQTLLFRFNTNPVSLYRPYFGLGTILSSKQNFIIDCNESLDFNFKNKKATCFLEKKVIPNIIHLYIKNIEVIENTKFSPN